MLSHRAPQTERAAAPGFFGKLPSQGDFVARRFDLAVRQCFDDWLGRGLAYQQAVRGPRWEADFRAMPRWRFVLAPGVAGPDTVAGVMAPSADRVGRCFPLVAASRLPPHVAPERLLNGLEDWFAALEAALGQAAHADPARLDMALSSVPPLLPHGAVAPEDRHAAGRTFWWAKDVGGRPLRFFAEGLPDMEAFGRFLPDSMDAPPEPAAPCEVRAVIAPVSVAPPRPEPMPAPAALRLSAVARTHAGTRLRVNADAVSAGGRDDLHVFVHGLGAPPDGPQAAGLLLERLMRAPPAADLPTLAANLKGAAGAAHALLRAGGSAGATFVALAAQGTAFEVLWAGDLRGYLWRDGLLRLLTRDHVEVGLTRRLSRLVGGVSAVSIDATGGGLAPGDRFLLVSAAVVLRVGERALADCLSAPTLAEAADAVVEEALVAGIAENASALVVDVALMGEA
ncbi:type VI secretion system-associated protein TagF [Xanthobacteraceae bacterium A53D]